MKYAPVMELVDMRDLGSRAATHVGSSPFRRTKKERQAKPVSPFSAPPSARGKGRPLLRPVESQQMLFRRQPLLCTASRERITSICHDGSECG